MMPAIMAIESHGILVEAIACHSSRIFLSYRKSYTATAIHAPKDYEVASKPVCRYRAICIWKTRYPVRSPFRKSQAYL